MSLSLPPGDILETPPGYPFEEITYEDIKVEEVGRWIWVVCTLWRHQGPVLRSNWVLLGFRWWEEELSESFAKPNGKAKTSPSRQLRVNRREKPSSWR